MLHVLGAYLAVAGGAAAGAQMACGAVRGAAQLVHGDAREVAGGIAAPVLSAVRQVTQLGVDVCRCATALTAEVRAKTGPAGAPAEPRVPTRRRRMPAVAANGAP
jgi:hypothetical protein